MRLSMVIASVLAFCSAASAQTLNLEFDAGVGGWRTVLDGVMGGRSTGRVSQPEAGILRFSGELSLENNGGFSQMQTTIPEGSLGDATGIEVKVRGDGRTYQFDVRCSNVRMMAGSFQAKFDTVAGEWVTVRFPWEQFRLHSFGRLVPNAPKLTPARVESIGITLSDKKAGPFKLDVDFIRAISPEGQSPAAGSSLAAVAQKAELTTLLSLVELSGLQLPTEGRVTVFAPSNAAFAALPAEKVKFLTSAEGRATLKTILRHHVVPSAIESGALFQRRGVLALSGQNLAIDRDELTIAGAPILKADLPFDGGILYVIDRVMIPETRPISEIVGQDARLSTLLKAVTTAGLAAQLGAENEGPWTLLAPSNEAFAALGEDTIKSLLADPARLTAVLAAHVIPSRVRRSDMIGQRSVRTLLGRESVPFALADGRITVAGAGIIAPDIEASNGVIHIIDRVIIPGPSNGKGSSADESGSSMPGVQELVQLAIERGVPAFNEGNPSACAAIYEVAITAIADLASEAIGSEGAERLRLVLAEGRAEKDMTKRAWIYRRGLDRVHQDAMGRRPR